MGAMIRVFLLDDHELVRRGLASVIERETDIVVAGESSSARDASTRIAACAPDVAVIDLSLRDGSGIDVCSEVTDGPTTTRPLVLTSVIDDRALIAAEAAGAWGFVLKTADSFDLIEAIRRVADGERLLDLRDVRAAELRLVQRDDGLLEQLTPREHRIFQMIGQGCSNRQIADELFISEKTVKNHMSSLLAKLKMSSRTEAAALAGRIDERESTWRP